MATVLGKPNCDNATRSSLGAGMDSLAHTLQRIRILFIHWAGSSPCSGMVSHRISTSSSSPSKASSTITQIPLSWFAPASQASHLSSTSLRSVRSSIRSECEAQEETSRWLPCWDEVLHGRAEQQTTSDYGKVHLKMRLGVEFSSLRSYRHADLTI